MEKMDFKILVKPGIVIGGAAFARQQLGSITTFNPERLAPMFLEGLGQAYVQAFIVGAGLITAVFFSTRSRH